MRPGVRRLRRRRSGDVRARSSVRRARCGRGRRTSIWAIPAGDGLFQLDACPTFARGLSHRDVVHVVPVGDRWYIDRVVRSNGHSTIRVVLFDDNRHGALMRLGDRLGLEVDHTEIQGLFAIDVPPEGPFRALVDELAAGQRRGWWDFEEGAVAAPHDDRKE